MSIRITATASTDLFVGTEATPRQLLRVTVERDPAAGAATVDVRGPRVAAAEQVAVPAGEGAVVVDVPLVLDGAVGDVLPCRVEVRGTDGDATADAEVTVEAPGWTMYLVSHFHYDPVWWNTQAAYTSPWEFLSGDATTRPLWEHNGFALVEAHLDLALRDPVYKFVLAEIDYLKPFFDTHPERRADLRRLLAEGRVELLGGTYNEPNTNLTGAETTIRNIVYGVGYQRDILGGDPQTAWQLDVFGHDPQFPGYLDAAGLTGSAWARGPFHQWGPALKTFRHPKGNATVMQFPSEFEWISPSGRGVLTHYMPNHYAAGWWMDASASLAEAEQATYELYRGLKPVAATPHILLPVGTDYTPPNKWVTQIHRSWAEKYVWPRFVCATPRDFLTAVRESMAARGVSPSPQTRDMNPLYTGKDVSYIDTKQAQRAAEVAVLDAERLATFATLLGGGHYPDAALDKVWRQLAYGAHHDAITGSESDQVYIDLVTGWREAYDLASHARNAALDALVSRVDTTGDGHAVVVANTLSFDRSDLVRVTLPDGVGGGRLVDDEGAEVPALVSGGVLTFRAEAVPSLGWRTWRLLPGEPTDTGWSTVDGDAVIENARLRVTADPARGGALASIYDKVAGRELVTAGRLANELRVYEEYPAHPTFGEGPWHLLPSGPVVDSSAAPAQVRVEHSVLGQRIVARGKVDDVDYEQVVTLVAGSDRVDVRTRVLDYSGADRLIRARFCCDIPGALPVSEVAAATVGRGFALPDVDTAEAPWTLDNPANTWFGLGSTARAVLSDVDGSEVGVRALGVAEVVVSDVDSAAPLARDLVVAMARVGVTATTSTATGSRYGWLSVDSNLPDFRIVIGGPDAAGNALAAELVERAGAAYRDELGRQLTTNGRGRVWVPAEKALREVWQPNADLRDARALPALVVVGHDADALAAELAALADDFADARITATHPGPVEPAEAFEDRSVALLTYGLPGFAVDPTGALHVSLMRSCTGWPSGVWIDPPKRTAPDGSSFQLQHWTHEFDYALVAGDGDWRALDLPARGQEYITPLLSRVVAGDTGDLPARHSLVRVEPARQVLLNALKPAGNPIAHGSGAASDPAAGVTLRLVESTGLGADATVTSALPWREAYRADLLERRGDQLAVDTGLNLTMAGSEVATLVAVPAAPAAVDVDAPVLGAVNEIAQPVYARYWLHNRGPAPMGYLPVTLAVSPGLVTADAAAPFTVDVSVASHLTDAEHEGVVGIVVPDGWHAEPADRVYRVDAGGHTSFPVTVTPAAGAEPGMYFVAAQLADGETMVEDVVSVALGQSDDVTALLPGAGDRSTGWEANKGTDAATGRDTGLELSTVDNKVTVRPGELRSIAVRLHNRTRGEIRGELQVASPWGTWDLLPSTVYGRPASPRGFRLAAGVTSINAFPVKVPATAEPGHYWALVKVMWFGRVQYSETIQLVVQA